MACSTANIAPRINFNQALQSSSISHSDISYSGDSTYNTDYIEIEKDGFLYCTVTAYVTYGTGSPYLSTCSIYILNPAGTKSREHQIGKTYANEGASVCQFVCPVTAGCKVKAYGTFSASGGNTVTTKMKVTLNIEVL